MSTLDELLTTDEVAEIDDAIERMRRRNPSTA